MTAQDEGLRVAAHQWRAQMMRLFASGGFSLSDAAAAVRNDSRRTFIESRLNYARKLKERFLGGAARFLLQDQDSSGIEKLERSLTDMIDDALRFSCRLWTRVAPHRLRDWKELGDKEFKCSSPLMTLCHAQAPVISCNHRHDKSKHKHSGSHTEKHGERSIIMLVQPAVVTDNVNLDVGKDGPVNENIALVWLRARVMVAGPMAPEPDVPAPAGIGSQSSPQSDDTTTKTPSTSSASSPGLAAATGEQNAVEILPPSSYKPPVEPAK